ncbi:hypothetical protein OG864_07645 [Streptomyces sp. NBC_00124]|uniref:hypothetical protein n=1 Tax=Streptomyces sp. NBC_00124 TaxID=2975662 RepID=UPI00225B224F|nr:hypothetical protein [Streptomyces sp. NBC_00124]MCX5358567.1 hypothetical protein [Streptomyces sp. NBC_00124]
MDAFLTTLGGKLADTWVSVLVLPGLLYVSVAAAGSVLGHRDAFDVGLLTGRLDDIAGSPAAHSNGTIALAAAFVVAAAAGASMLASFLGGAVERLWLGEWPAPLDRVAAPLTRWRSRRWAQAQDRYHSAVRSRAAAADVPDELDPDRTPSAAADTVALNEARNRISLAPPRRPTWMGDRLTAVDHRVFDAYRIDLSSAWPRLWLLLPQTPRTDLTTARDAFSSAARRAGWALLYLAVAPWWWPAALVAAVTSVSAWRGGRDAAHTFAELVESAVDLHARRLATALGVSNGRSTRLTHDAGREITRLLRKKT